VLAATGKEHKAMKRSQFYGIGVVGLAFFLGVAAGTVFHRPLSSILRFNEHTSDLAGIEKLHELDQRITLLNDPKALQQEWEESAIRLEAEGPPDIGKASIYASDVRSFSQSPGAAFVSYRPDIRDVRLAGDWAFEWGLFDAGYRMAPNKPIQMLHGKLLRVLHRQPGGDWKFARVMVVLDS
jgi:ketosteroid isomerase-like protein